MIFLNNDLTLKISMTQSFISRKTTDMTRRKMQKIFLSLFLSYKKLK